MRTTGLLLIIVFATSVSISAQEENGDRTVATIRALEHEWETAQSRNDNLALDRIFDNALVYIESGKLVTKGEYLSRIRVEDPSQQQVVVELERVSIFGNTAIVVGIYRERSRKGGKSHLQTWRYIYTWVLKKGSWVLVAAAASPLTR